MAMVAVLCFTKVAECKGKVWEELCHTVQRVYLGIVYLEHF